jgi:hypothetical protein
MLKTNERPQKKKRLIESTSISRFGGEVTTRDAHYRGLLRRRTDEKLSCSGKNNSKILANYS